MKRSTEKVITVIALAVGIAACSQDGRMKPMRSDQVTPVCHKGVEYVVFEGGGSGEYQVVQPTDLDGRRIPCGEPLAGIR